MKSIKGLVKNKQFKRLNSKSILTENFDMNASDDVSLVDLESLNKRLIHFFNPKGLMKKTKQHTNAHNYEITLESRYLLGGLVSQSHS